MRASRSRSTASFPIAVISRRQNSRTSAAFSVLTARATMGFPNVPSRVSRWTSPSAITVRIAAATFSSSSVAWQNARASTQWNIASRSDRVEDLRALFAQVLQPVLVHDHVVRGRDDLGEAPAHLALLPTLELLVRDH